MTQKNLPPRWLLAPLADVASASNKKVEPADTPAASYLSLEHIEAETGTILGSGSASDVRSTKAVFRAGDVLYGRLRPYLNKVCRPSFDGVCSTDILVFRESAALSNAYLELLLRRRATVEHATQESKGINLPRVSLESLGELEVPVPPRDEQKRIAKTVNILRERTRNAREALEAIRPLIEKFRQSIFASAASGRLTAQWRSTRPHALPAASDGATSQPTAGAFAIPDSWRWTVLENVTENFDSFRIPIRASDRSSRRGEYPYYGAFGVIDSIDEYLFDGEYLLLAEDGKNLETRDRPISLIARGQFWVNNHAHVLQAKPMLSLRYLNCWLNGPTFDLSDFLTGIDQVKLTKAAMNRIPVPLPPLEEQEAIAARAELLLARAEQSGRLCADESRRIESLETSILAKAFRGELVPQDPNDEPASVLLERIRAERENATTPARRARAGGTSDNSPGRSPGRKAKPRINPSPGGAIARDTPEPLNRPSGTRDDRSTESPGLRPGQRSAASPALEHTTDRAEREDRPRSSIDDYTIEDILAAFRHAMPTASRYDRDDVIRAVARHLGFDRAGSRIRGAIESALPTAARRHIAWYSGTEVWIATRTITDYTRDELKDYFLAAIGPTWHTRPEAIRLATRYLGFTRTGPTIEDTWKSIINGLLRDGRIVRDSRLIQRASIYS